MVTKASKKIVHSRIIASRITNVMRHTLDVHCGQGYVLSAKMVHIKKIDNAQVSEAYDASKPINGCKWKLGLGIDACVHFDRTSFVAFDAVNAFDIRFPDRPPTSLLSAPSFFEWLL